MQTHHYNLIKSSIETDKKQSSRERERERERKRERERERVPFFYA